MHRKPDAADPPPLGLALQGGGAHGAFTWGVLDRLLEEPTFTIEAVSGTSSGALNALAVAQGWLEGGREGARACLDTLWTRIGTHAQMAQWMFGVVSPAGREAMLNLHRYFTPRQMNPLAFNPVRQIAESLFDFERLRAAPPFELHLAATRVRDGALMLFGRDRINLDALLASTCLPQLFAPVTIDDEVYWDGGWAGNPVLEPLLYEGRADTILCVLVQPLTHTRLPTTASEISERISELGFSTTFLRELRTLTLARDSLDGAFTLSWLGRRLKRLDFQLIEPGESLDAFQSKSSAIGGRNFLDELKAYGRGLAERWINDPPAHSASPSVLANGGFPAP